MKYMPAVIATILRKVILGLLIVPAAPMATVHLIEFGGGVGFNYSPNNLTVASGDTIRWRGDFVLHPLSSTVIPVGAAAWHAASGASYDYPVTVPGEYHYGCDAHSNFGMTGVFIAMPVLASEDIGFQSTLSLRLLEIEPNPAFQSSIHIRYSVSKAQNVNLSVLDLQGRKMVTLAHGHRNVGSYQVNLFPDKLPSGAYICRLQGNGANWGRTLYVIN